jgi:hypothetical protein
LKATTVEGIKELAVEIDRERLERARRMKPEAKLSAGIELFEFACSMTRAGIKHDFPQADAAEVERILAERLALARRLEIGGWKPNR